MRLKHRQNLYHLTGTDRGRRLERSPPLKPTKVTLFTLFLYISENNISKPIPNKSLVMFEQSYCSRFQSSIVLPQRCCEVYFIFLTVAKSIGDLTTKYYWTPRPPYVTSWIRPCHLKTSLPRCRVWSCTPYYVCTHVFFYVSCTCISAWLPVQWLLSLSSENDGWAKIISIFKLHLQVQRTSRNRTGPVNGVEQRGPTKFDLRANLQKRENLRATSNKMMCKTTDSQDLKLKMEDKWAGHWNYYTTANSNLL